jgi:signal transduction histidine kinase
VFGAILLVVTIVYSNYLANQLEKNEEKQGAVFVEALKEIAKNTNLNSRMDLEAAILDSFALPVIFQGEDGSLTGSNWCELHDSDSLFLQNKIMIYLESARKPFLGPGGYASQVFVFNSPTLTYIRYFPIVQLVLISVFVLFAYFLFNASRRAEQNRVWAGMAKETAHQLGTPISAILGWIEYLKTMSEDNSEQQEVLSELVKDVDRLELVADRFSKIGSTPALKPINLYEEILKCKRYMQRRSPKKVEYIVPTPPEENIQVGINDHLFDWVIENLYRNALDAMDGKGTISTRIYRDHEFACVDIADTGKGIPSSKFKSVFKPGFSTKQRGWGLGLSLAKRIIESYHKGKIFVKSSKIGEGTTFTIKLPLAND